MPLGEDKQYDESWVEQDKMRRRREIRQRLKLDGINRRYNPFFHLKKKLYSDPAVDRYMDLRKQGRMPGTPFSPKLFFMINGCFFIPIIVIAKLIEWERTPYLKKCESGEIPYADMPAKTML